MKEKLLDLNCGDTGERIFIDPNEVASILPYDSSSCRVFLKANPAAIMVWGCVDYVHKKIESSTNKSWF